MILTRLVRRTELGLLEPVNQRVERPVQHLDDVARRNLMPEQVLRVAQLVMHGLAHRELERVALGRQRRHSGPRIGVLAEGQWHKLTSRRGRHHDWLRHLRRLDNWPYGQLLGRFDCKHASW